MTISIRPAGAGEQSAIVALVRSEALNPTNLDWRRFTLALSGEMIVGAVQVRLNRDGSRELGSLVVKPDLRGQGIAGRLIDAALARVPGQVWAITAAAFTDHYRAWGFVRAEKQPVPRTIRFHHRIGRTMGILNRIRGRTPKDLTVLVRKGAAAGEAEAEANPRLRA
jgi:amino-acid N-acetyltransferase